MVLAHARAELLNEACGLLSGSAADGLGPPSIQRAPGGVAAALQRHPEDLVRITFDIDDAGEDLVGIFHSHTHSPAVPSPTDRRAAMYPDAVYLLASLADREAPPDTSLRAWRIAAGEATEVALGWPRPRAARRRRRLRCRAKVEAGCSLLTAGA